MKKDKGFSMKVIIGNKMVNVEDARIGWIVLIVGC